MKTWMYVALGVVVLLIIYFVFIRKKPEVETEETNYQVQQSNNQQGQMGYTSSVAQIIQSLTGLTDSVTGGTGFLNNQPVN